MSALRRPLPKVGRVALRWQRWRQQNHDAVSRRCRGKCEVCGIEKNSGPGLDVHHVAGRRNIVEEPWASWHLLMCGVCRSCHNAIHADPLGKEANLVQTACMDRLQDHSDGRLTEPWPDARPLDVIREYVRRLQDEGFDPMEARP